MLRKQKIGVRLAAASLLAAAPLIILALLAYYTMRSTIRGLETVYEDRVVPMQDLKAISDAYAIDVVDTLHKLRAGNLQASTALQRIDSADSLAETRWKAYIATRLTTEEEVLVRDAESKRAAARRSLARVRPLVERGDREATVRFIEQELYPAVDPFTEIVSKLVDLQLREARREYDAAENRYLFLIVFLVAGSAVSLVIAVTGTAFIARSILVPLKNTVAVMARVERGDLTGHISDQGADELADLSRGTNSFVGAVRDLALQLNEQAGQLGNSAESLDRVSTTLAASAKDVASQSSTIAASAVEMSQTLQTVASSAEEMSVSVNDVARHASETAAAGNAAGTSALESQTILKELGVRAGEIGTVIDAIGAIAAQWRSTLPSKLQAQENTDAASPWWPEKSRSWPVRPAQHPARSKTASRKSSGRWSARLRQEIDLPLRRTTSGKSARRSHLRSKNNR